MHLDYFLLTHLRGYKTIFGVVIAVFVHTSWILILDGLQCHERSQPLNRLVDAARSQQLPSHWEHHLKSPC